MALTIGDQAPNFTLPSTSGHDFTLDITAKERACILYFYPKNFTPGCNKEACDFRDHFHTFKNIDIDVFGISTDTISSHRKFIDKYDLQFDLLSDKKGNVSKLYDARIPVLNISKRVTYLLDTAHTIVAVYEDMFGAENHIKMMLSKIQVNTN